MNKATLKTLNRLNRKIIYCDFDLVQSDGFVHSFETEYFGFDIKVIMIETIRGGCVLTVFVENWLNKVADLQLLSTEDRFIFENVDSVIAVLNEFITEHPFTIIRYSRGCYRLLDPNGYDHTGEYVTKQDAMRTSDNNFVYQA